MMNKLNLTTEELINDLILNKKTMVWEELFDTIIRKKSYLSNIEGDIVECGVWRGGYSIFLTHLFPLKKIYVCDSYEGFQPLDQATYDYAYERHVPSYTQSPHGPLAISLQEVQNNFKEYGVDTENVEYVKGFVNQTLPTLPIKQISILRIDVDSFSATLDVLNELYDKVVEGGIIIFDDACLYESADAIKSFFTQRGLPLTLNNPMTDEEYSLATKVCESNSGYHAGSYIIKG